MNIILLAPDEARLCMLPPEDSRARHLLSVLRARPGDSFAAGIVNGGAGRMEILSVTCNGLRFRFEEMEEAEPLLPLDIIIGLPRPLVAGRLLKDLASLGLRSIHFARSALCEKSYMSAGLWKNGGCARHVLEGLAQAGATRTPEVRLHADFQSCLACFAHSPEAALCALDPRAGEGESLERAPRRASAVLAVGPERGWTAGELEALGGAGFRVYRLGRRVLRTEAAALAASAIMLSRMGLMEG
jgi:RsmE family RNA methyltransferase